MKKSFFFAALMLGAFVLVGCNNESGTPQGDSTKLWPAQPDEGTQWGYTNGKDPKLALSAKYKSAASFSCGLALVKDDNDDYQFIKSNGEKAGKMPDIEGAPHDFYFDVCRVKISGFFAYLDKDLKKVTKADFKQLEDMSKDGLAPCQIDGEELWGYCDKEGTIRIKAEYDYAYEFMDGIAVVKQKQGDNYVYFTIDTNGKALMDPTKKFLSNLGEQRVYYMDNQKVVMTDKYGNDIELEVPISDIQPFTEGLAVVTNKNGDKRGYMDPKGAVKIDFEYSQATPMFEGLAWVKTTGSKSKWKVINKNGGDEKLELSTGQNIGYDELPTYFHNGLTYYNNGRKVYLANKDADVKYEWKLANGRSNNNNDPNDPNNYDPNNYDPNNNNNNNDPNGYDSEGEGGYYPGEGEGGYYPEEGGYAPARIANPMRGTKYGPIFDEYLRNRNRH